MELFPISIAQFFLVIYFLWYNLTPIKARPPPFLLTSSYRRKFMLETMRPAVGAVTVALLHPDGPGDDPGGRRQFTVLHTNDFHGNLGGCEQQSRAARVAAKIQQIRRRRGPSVGAVVRCRGHHPGLTDFQCYAGSAYYPVLQDHRLRRRHFRQPRIRLGPDGAGGPDSPGGRK